MLQLETITMIILHFLYHLVSLARQSFSSSTVLYLIPIWRFLVFDVDTLQLNETGNTKAEVICIQGCTADGIFMVSLSLVLYF